VDAQDIVKSMNKKQKSQIKRRHWNKLIKNLAKNPHYLMNIVPSPRNDSGSRDKK